ncbi:uncharacterized protein LOC107637321 [Arachis ipaensis]|uniref:uncharacterized protein LOC107637321 n=1 Tax=Arachis ipaensis TaxID=130454 RepID=UPI0007AEED17|nr:uncharacterized protein LOC107637321 [Arachis ipaensis]XP_025648355.1 uncharacterized protein LOC112743358 [Arachis hypogaea]
MTIPEAPPVFDKIYICLDACKRGFKEGCRSLLHLDGCFLKTYYMGWLLAAVPQDTNNQFYVVAYGVVRAETKDAWKWFLTNLQADIGDDANHGWNFISDQQKGLLPALKEVMPKARHRNCVMHMWKNFVNRFKDLYIREVVWECARCTTVAEFKDCMERLKAVNQGLGNTSPSLSQRHGSRLISRMGLRCYLMRRMVNHKRVLENHPGKLAPVQQKRMERLLTLGTKWTAEWVGDNERKMFEVSRKGSKVDVDLIKYTCSCNRWQLIGMPCTHALAAIVKRRDKTEDYVHPWLCMESIRRTYSHCIKPVPSAEFWPRTEYSQPEPPIIKRPIGRPKVHNR